MHGVRYATHAVIKAEAFEYIVVFYNRKRRHSTLRLQVTCSISGELDQREASGKTDSVNLLYGRRKTEGPSLSSKSNTKDMKIMIIRNVAVLIINDRNSSFMIAFSNN